MKNKLIACVTVLFLIVDTVIFATIGRPATEITQKEEEVIEETKPLIPLEPIEEIVITKEEEVVEAPPPENTKVTSDEFPEAAKVWNALKAKGWSDEMCAGIMGNIMAECGGKTLQLNVTAIGDSGTSYGICQWHNGRKNNLLQNFGGEIEDQVDFLEYELTTQYNDLYEKWKASTSYEQIAYEFCVYFERPNNKYVKAENRKALAQTAFEYFIGK